MNKFAQKALAKKQAGNDKRFEGLKRLKMEQLIALYPNGVLITEFRKFSGDNGDWYAFAFAEDQNAYFGGTTILNNMADTWVEEGQTVIEASDELKKLGGIKLKLFWTTNKRGQQMVDYEVIG